MKQEFSQLKQDMIAEIEQRLEDKVLERSNAELLKKLIMQADSDDEAIKIMSLGTTYKKSGLHYEKRLERMDNTIRYYRKNEALSFHTDDSKPTHKTSTTITTTNLTTMSKDKELMKKELSLNPVNAVDARNLTEVLGIMGDNSQSKVAGCDSYHDVKISYNDTLAGERLSYLGIVTSPVAKWQDCKCLCNFLRLLKMTFYSLTVKSSISKFGNGNLRSKNLFGRCLCNMLVYTSAMAEVFNPSVRIKDVPFHNGLIIKSYLAVQGTAIVAMLHHLIILLTFSILRPDACQTQEASLALFSRKLRRSFFGHNQLIGQPLSITLRERKPLQICP